MILGIDGADWTVIDRMLDEGKLPHFRQVIDGGVRATMLSLEDYKRSPVIWTSLMTGRLPADHGIDDFTYRDSQSGELIPVTSAQRRVPALWNIASSQGIKTTVIGMWATFPAESIKGVMVSDRCAFLACKPEPERVMEPEVEKELTWPAEFFQVIKPFLNPAEYRIPPVLEQGFGRLADLNKTDRWVFKQTFTDFHADDVHYLKQSFQEDYAKMVIGESILESTESAPDLYINYFRGTDVAQHFFWRYFDPGSFGLPPENPELFNTLITDYYQYMDEILKVHLARLRPDDDLIVISDHGSQADHRIQAELFWSNKFNMDRWRSRMESLFRAFGFAQPQLGVSEGLPGVTLGRDWGKNNLAFQIDPTASGAALEELKQTVLERVTGVRILPQELELFRYAPDVSSASVLVFSATNLYDIDFDTRLRINGGDVLLRDLFLLRKRSGDHRREGVFIGYGNDFNPGIILPEISVLDVAPLTLTLLHLPRGVNMPGQIPEEALRGPALKYLHRQKTQDYMASWTRQQGKGTQDRERVEQLKGLGYISN